MWTYNRIEFTDDMIPEGAVGFVYGMSTVLNGEKKYYVGKKLFYSDIKTKLGKKELEVITDKRRKTYKRVKKTSYKNYYSSNIELKKAHSLGIPITRRILKICYSKLELTYEETKMLFKLDVLENDLYLNSNILGKFFKKPTK